jgi:ribA/ribD-fused uncharacterized protein
MIKFKFTNAPYGFLSNFSLHPVTFGGRLYKTTEHLYQSMKFQDHDSREQIRAAMTAKESAQLGRTLPGMVANWDDIKLDVMRKIIRLKVEQHPVIAKGLLMSGEAELVEDSNKDTFWGRKPTGEGYNWLGVLWMELRKELQNASVSHSR